MRPSQGFRKQAFISGKWKQKPHFEENGEPRQNGKQGTFMFWGTGEQVNLFQGNQGRSRRSGRMASAGPLFWTSMPSAVSLFSRFGSFFFVLTSDFQFIDAIINDARCACHPKADLAKV